MTTNPERHFMEIKLTKPLEHVATSFPAHPNVRIACELVLATRHAFRLASPLCHSEIDDSELRPALRAAKEAAWEALQETIGEAIAEMEEEEWAAAHPDAPQD